jgi:hypothetical protein
VKRQNHRSPAINADEQNNNDRFLCIISSFTGETFEAKAFLVSAHSPGKFAGEHPSANTALRKFFLRLIEGNLTFRFSII